MRRQSRICNTQGMFGHYGFALTRMSLQRSFRGGLLGRTAGEPGPPCPVLFAPRGVRGYVRLATDCAETKRRTDDAQGNLE